MKRSRATAGDMGIPGRRRVCLTSTSENLVCVSSSVYRLQLVKRPASSVQGFLVPSFLTRRISFAAAHRYRRPDWSDDENDRVFGLCARHSYHGHSYTCDVTVTGAIDERTGMIVDLAQLDAVLAREVRQRFDHRNINVDVPEFADGKRIPTGEELARFVHGRVQSALAPTVRVVEVVIAEDETLRASYRPD